MEMLAIYFAIADNLVNIIKMSSGRRKKRRVIIAVRSDSKSTIEQLRGMSEVRDLVMQRIRNVITKLLLKIKYTLVFDYLDRSKNIAGLLLEQKRRKEREKMISMFPSASIESYPLIKSSSGMPLIALQSMS